MGLIDAIQVLRDEIGTAVRHIKSCTDHFSLIMHGQDGEGETKKAFLGKEGAQVCVTQKICSQEEKFDSQISPAAVVPQGHNA